MQVSRWGNSLAVRLPVAVAVALGLQDGDEIAIGVAEGRHFRAAPSRPGVRLGVGSPCVGEWRTVGSGLGRMEACND